jgi:predicted Zn-dependent peptidase
MIKTYPTLMEDHHVHILENGLTVYIVQKKDTKTQTAFFAVPFGGLNLCQYVAHEVIQYPAGIAHFLEHKLFEDYKGLDVMQQFTKRGAQVNAFTSHNETVYYFRTSRLNFKYELNLLLDFVQSFSITEEAVEKEKGIITQELKMYQQIPEQRLILETYRSLFHHHPIREDIGGDEESIQRITKKILEACHAVNYQPKQSVLVVITSKSAEEVLNWIQTNQARKVFRPAQETSTIYPEELKTVHREHYIFDMDIQSTKMTLSYKLNLSNPDHLINLHHEWSLRFLLELKFTAINEAYQSWIVEHRIHDYFGFDLDVNPSMAFVLFFIEGEDELDFQTLITSTLAQSIDPYKENIALLKRRYIAQMIRSFDDHDDYALSLIRSDFLQIPLDASISVIEAIELNDLIEMQERIIQSPTVLVKMRSKNTP